MLTKLKNWIKGVWRRFKKWIIALFVVSVASVSLVPFNGSEAPTTQTERGWNYVTDVRGPEKTTEFHGKWINYKRGGQWAPINTAFSTSTDGSFEMTGAPFRVYVPERSTGQAQMVNDNEYDIFSKADIQDAPLTMTITALGVNDVPGETAVGDLIVPTGLQEDVPYVVYKNAYTDADLIYYVDFGRAPRLEKLIMFHEKPSVLTYSFDIGYSDPIDMTREVSGKKTKWSESSKMSVPKDKPVEVAREGSSKRGIGFKVFQIWDSNYEADPRNIEPIQVEITPKTGNSYTLTKILPGAFFDTAMFPVYTDTTSTFYPDPNVETTSVDGWIRSGVQASWAAARDATSGTADDSSSTGDDPRADKSGANYSVSRIFTLFDTSSLPDGDSIDSATYSISYATALSTNNANSTTIEMVQTSPASNTSLTANDFDNVTFTSGGSKTLASGGTGYADITVNATGLTWISKTGITKLGEIIGLDLSNTSPTGINGGSNNKCAEEAGTGSDPKLVVNHTTPPPNTQPPMIIQFSKEIGPISDLAMKMKNIVEYRHYKVSQKKPWTYLKSVVSQVASASSGSY